MTQRHRHQPTSRGRAWEPRSRRCRRVPPRGRSRAALPAIPLLKHWGHSFKALPGGETAGRKRSFAYGACSGASVWAGSPAQSLSEFREAPLIGLTAQATPQPTPSPVSRSYLPGQPPGFGGLENKGGSDFSGHLVVKFLQTFWKKLELRPTYPKSENPGQKLILKRTGENNLVIEGKTASILDLMSRPGTVRLGAQACTVGTQ